MNEAEIQTKLNRLKSTLAAPAAPSQVENFQRNRNRKLAQATGGDLHFNEAGCYCLIRSVCDGNELLGHTRLGSCELSKAIPHSAFSYDDNPDSTAAKDLLFFDIESTGLGGAGVVPFLVGIGLFTSEGFEVSQYLLPDYPDEAAMLEEIARQFTPDTTLVSYNGITFDFNLLKERFILHRIQRDIPHQHHIDLLHTTRRLFRRRLRDCTLSNIERELFTFYRTDDIPGYLVPSVYFAWLAEDEVEQIGRVVSHNRQDIVTLAFLLHRILAVFETAGEELSHPDDLYSLSRIYGRRKQIGRVVALLDSIEQASRSPQMLFDQAMALKRCGDREAAAAIWEQLAATGGPVGFGAGIELAKYYEHMVADNRRALRVLEQVAPFCPDRIRPKTELRRRWKRLQGRLLKK